MEPQRVPNPVEEPDGSATEWADPTGSSTPEVRDLFIALGKALRAVQLYEPNNPVYRRFLDGLRAEFRSIWEEYRKLTFLTEEDRITWDGQVVYESANRSDSLAFLLFADGIRELTFRPGVEAEEIETFLRSLHRARTERGGADTLVTILWEHDFHCLEYEVVDLLAEGIPLPEPGDPFAGSPLDILEGEGFGEEELQAAVEEGPPEPAEGIIRPQDFNPTLYAMDPAEREELEAMIRAEHERPVRRDVLNALLDRVEERGFPSRQREIAGILRALLPNFLTRGRLESAALILEELEEIRGQGVLDPEADALVDALLDDLTHPEVIGELVRALEDGTLSPSARELSLLFRHMRPSALPILLAAVETTPRPTVRRVLKDAIRQIGSSAPERVLALLDHGDERVVAGAVRLAGTLRLQAAAPVLARLLDNGPLRVQRAVVDVAAEIPSSIIATALERALDDPDRDLRIGAARALGGTRYAPAAEVLQAVLGSKDFRWADVSEKVAYFDAYARLAGERGIPFLKRLLVGRGLLGYREPPEIRAAAAHALGVVGTDAAISVLESVRDDADPVVRSAVNRAWRGEEMPA
ncbi:MAG: HEAT repeat domain-containing protein [Gemmatimonadales bacterium]|nr:MAG: HEAT repeat domain-containing protein [Gemmatimonadales bacterium]